MRTTPSFWRTRGFVAWALWPLSLLYRGGQWVDGTLKQVRQKTAPIPIVSVGNLRAGGSGKTPLVATLARALSAEGHTVAILSRGYGGSTTHSTQINPAHTASQVGDEPLALYRQQVAAQVWVGADRYASACKAAQAGATLCLLDDGYQHRTLARNVNLLVVGESGFGNGFLLPAGPLREPLRAAVRADAVVVIGSHTAPHLPVKKPVFYLHRGPEDVSRLQGRPAVAFAALADPEGFFSRLRAAGATLAATLPLPDHAPYTRGTLEKLAALQQEHQAVLVTTGKDMAKLPPAFAEQVAALDPVFEAPGIVALLKFIEEQLNKVQK